MTGAQQHAALCILAQWHSGTVAQWHIVMHIGTVAQWHSGTSENRNIGKLVSFADVSEANNVYYLKVRFLDLEL